MTEASQTLDLLCEEPETRLRLATLERALGFAFSAGDTSGLFERALSHATNADSSFDAKSFADDLFIDEFLDRCLPMPAKAPLSAAGKAYVRSILCSPPRHPSTTEMRQEILRELSADAALAQRFERCHAEASELRSLLSASDPHTRYDISQRRIDVLRGLKTLLDHLAEDFAACRSQLSRLSDFARKSKAGSGYARLAELLDYEDNLATLDVRVRVGIDGRLRDFSLLRHRENESNGFHQSWLARFWRRLFLFLRGYRLGDQELLVRLTDQVFEGLKLEVLQLFQLIGDMDFYRAGLGLARLAATQGLASCLPSFDANAGVRLEAVWNPFLVAEGIRVRCCDLEAKAPESMTIITGPNSGGKTRLLQAVALCQLLGQAGLPVPAAAARLCWTRGMFVSIVQQPSADQREGRLGMELLRIRRLFEHVTPGDVIVLDELCSGTNPSEGEEIFRLVIQLLAELKPQLWLTTHFLQFAERLQSEAAIAGLDFLRVELDADEHPTFAFVPGVAKSSLAGQTAARLGVTWQELSALVAAAKQRTAKS